MKKALFFSVILAILSCSANAFALAYSDSETFSKDLHPLGTVSLTFSKQQVLPTDNFTSADLYLTGNVKPFLFKNVAIGIAAGNIFNVLYVGKLSNEISLNLNSLNNYIHSFKVAGPINLTLLSFNGRGALSGATLTGSLTPAAVAPEPLSMFLVGAGLVGLPFVRRFRKSLN